MNSYDTRSMQGLQNETPVGIRKMRFEGSSSVAETPQARLYQNTAYESFGS